MRLDVGRGRPSGLGCCEALGQQAAAAPGTIQTHPCDVTSPESVAACAQAMTQAWGGMDVVIPNAGIGYFNPLQEAPLEEWHAMVDVNVSGVLSTLHAALPSLVENKGHVINIGSLAARQVFPNSGVYCATKDAACFVGIASDRIPQQPRRDHHQPWGRQHAFHRPHHQRRIGPITDPNLTTAWRPITWPMRCCLRWKVGARGGQRADDSPRSR